jgi:hypothetical protein
MSASYTPRGAILVPTASVLNRVVRSLLTSPERSTFKPAAQLASHNPLIWRASHNRTKMAVVRWRQRRGPERDGKRPEMGFRAGSRGSEKWPGRPAFCAVPAAGETREKNVPTGETGGGTGIRTLSTVVLAATARSARPDRHRGNPAGATPIELCLKTSGQAAPPLEVLDADVKGPFELQVVHRERDHCAPAVSVSTNVRALGPSPSGLAPVCYLGGTLELLEPDGKSVTVRVMLLGPRQPDQRTRVQGCMMDIRERVPLETTGGPSST